jgi:hypothetical protein
MGGTAVGWADDGTASGASTPNTGTTQTHSPARGGPAGASAAGDAPTSVPGSRRGPRGAGPGESRVSQRASDSDYVAPTVSAPDINDFKDVKGANDIERQAAAALPAAATPTPLPEVAAPAVDTAPSTASYAVSAAPVAQIIQVTPATAAPVAAPPAAVASVVPAIADALGDPFASGNTGIPVGSALDWTVLAFARRNPLAAASTPALPKAAATEETIPVIMGPSGVPIPSQNYVNTVLKFYIPNAIPGSQQVLFTPEGLYPITGVKSLPLNTSVDQGIQILSDELKKFPAGTPVTVFGYSQSAIISSLMQGGYTVRVDGQDVKIGVPDNLKDSISFVMVGNEMNPDGGFLSRFSGRGLPTLTLESLGIPFYGATPGGPVPANGVEYPTINYAQEYDGFADFPRYPINLLSAINAGLGIVYVHTKYTPRPDCQTFCVTEDAINGAIALPSTSPSQQYYFIRTANLPILEPLRSLPVIGKALAALIQPALKVIVDFGYADQAHGFATAGQPNANELQPFGVSPPLAVYGEAVQKFFAGIEQGIKDFIAELGPKGSVAQGLSALSLPNLGPLGLGASGSFISSVQQIITSVSDYISGAVAGIYAALLPTADVINALVTTLPAYATNLFLYGMQEVFAGDVLKGLSDAIGLPIAATVGLSSTAALVAALVWGQALVPLFPSAVAEV